jgi:transposase
MRKPTFHLSSEQINELQGADYGCDDVVTRIRYQAVRLYGQGYATVEVLAITGCSRTSLLKWCRRYRQGGVAGLVDQRNGGNSAKLGCDDLTQLTSYLHQSKPNQVFASDEYQGNGEFWTIRDLAALLQRDYQVAYKSPNSYRTVLRRCGLSRQRPAVSYRSRREANVIGFEETLEKNCSTWPKVHPTP